MPELYPNKYGEILPYDSFENEPVSISDRFRSNAILREARPDPCTTPVDRPVQAEFLESQLSAPAENRRGSQRMVPLAVVPEICPCGIRVSA